MFRQGPQLIVRAARADEGDAETLARQLHACLTPHQRAAICFDWDHRDEYRGLLRAFVSNHWQPTRPAIRSAFFAASQQAMIAEVFRRLIDPAWHALILRQLEEDTHHHRWGADQSIVFFGDPESGPWQFVLAGRHVTLRAGTDTGAAFGGPVLYGHARGGFYGGAGRENIFSGQAVAAETLFASLDEDMRRTALVPVLRAEHEMAFGAPAQGIAVSGFSPAQRGHFGVLLNSLLAPYRVKDRARAGLAIEKQGGAAALGIAFAAPRQAASEARTGFRVEGPAFIWHFRGWPHVHGWVHIADDPSHPGNGRSGRFLFKGQDRLQ